MLLSGNSLQQAQVVCFCSTDRTLQLSTSQITVQKQLQQFLTQHQQGGKEGSVISSKSISSGDSKTWRDIRKELERCGISVAAFDQNKAFIFDWLQDAMRSGKLDDGQISHISSRSLASEESSHISSRSVASEESQRWREIRKDLQGVGLTPAAFNTHRPSILDWFEDKFRTGEFKARDKSNEKEDNADIAVLESDSILNWYEDNFRTGEFKVRDKFNGKDDNADFAELVLDSQTCQDRINQWLFGKLEISRVEMARHKAELGSVYMEDEAWWSLVCQFWLLDTAGDGCNSKDSPSPTEESIETIPKLIATSEAGTFAGRTRLRAWRSCSAII